VDTVLLLDLHPPLNPNGIFLVPERNLSSTLKQNFCAFSGEDISEPVSSVWRRERARIIA
jgi:hypothetical protein